MTKRGAQVFQGLTDLSAAELAEVLEELKRFQHYQRFSFQESKQFARTVITKAQLGPLDSNICLCCGR